MTDQQVARGSGLTTEEAASAGTTDRDDIRVEAPSQGPETDDAEAGAQRLEGEELQGVVRRWRDIQARFVDEPRAAVQDADALVADLMQRLARLLAAERHELESHWTSAEAVSTEDLRQGLLRYRSFFERLLAASGGTGG